MMYGEDTKISNFNDGRIKKKFTTDYDKEKNYFFKCKFFVKKLLKKLKIFA